MNPCKTCMHAMPVEAAQLIRCGYPVPIWITRELRAAGASSGWELVDYMNAEYGDHDCSTYQPREERETQP